MSINSLIRVTQVNKYLCRTFSAEENVLLLSLSILPTDLIYTFYVFIFQVYDSAVTKWRDLQTLYTAMCVGISASVSFFFYLQDHRMLQYWCFLYYPHPVYT